MAYGRTLLAVLLLTACADDHLPEGHVEPTAERTDAPATVSPAPAASIDCAAAASPISPGLASLDGRRLLHVGPGRQYESPSAVASIARDGDAILIDAASYPGDVAVWKQHDLLFRGVGGRPHLIADGAHADGKGIWVLMGDDTIVESIEFSGARVPDRNGAGIRLHGRGLVVKDSYFHDNENGILGGEGSDSDVLIEHSEFARNGHGDGQSHNIYIGRVRSLTLRFNYVHGARVGHQVKSRAANNYILYNRLIDGDDGNGSYVIDIAEGGRAFVIGNELHQGRRARNSHMVAFGIEQRGSSEHGLYVVNNTFYNERPNGVFVHNASQAPASLINNLFAGAPASVLTGPGRPEGNLQRAAPGLSAPSRYEYSLRIGSPAIDAGSELPVIEHYDLRPSHEYVHPRSGRLRPQQGRLDVGAHEYCPPSR